LDIRFCYFYLIYNGIWELYGANFITAGEGIVLATMGIGQLAVFASLLDIN
jgi:hypothetical protein